MFVLHCCTLEYHRITHSDAHFNLCKHPLNLGKAMLGMIRDEKYHVTSLHLESTAKLRMFKKGELHICFGLVVMEIYSMM